jgi:hypothetical protein
MKLTERTAVRLARPRALAALKDLERNGGFMLEPESGQEAAMLWRELRRRGWVDGYRITRDGRQALASPGGRT